MTQEVHEIIGRSFRHTKQFQKILDRANDELAIGNLTLEEYDLVVRELKDSITETRALLVEVGKTL